MIVPKQHPLHEFFAEEVETEFDAVREVREEISVKMHIVKILEKFWRTEDLFTLPNPTPNAVKIPVGSLDDLLIAADAVNGTASSFDREREIRIHIGDLSLFLAGMWWEGMPRHPSWKHPILYGKTDRDLRDLGSENYRIAASFDLFEYEKEANLFATLARHFIPCERGMALLNRKFSPPR